jgi:hypothetical protein
MEKQTGWNNLGEITVDFFSVFKGNSLLYVRTEGDCQVVPALNSAPHYAGVWTKGETPPRFLIF